MTAARPQVPQTLVDCSRVVAAVINRDSRAECDKAHKRFVKQLRASADALSTRKDKR